MSYTPLNIPTSTPSLVQKIIRKSVDPLLDDVHWMLATAVSARGPKQQLQFPIALTLLAAIAGVSTQLLWVEKSTNTGERFRTVLRDYYPWEMDSPQGASKKDAVSVLYDVYRNPLMHNLGLRTETTYQIKIGRILRGTEDAEVSVEELEKQKEKPYSKSSLVVTPEKRVLWLDPFYWAVRKTIESWATDSEQVTHAAERLQKMGKKT